MPLSASTHSVLGMLLHPDAILSLSALLFLLALRSMTRKRGGYSGELSDQLVLFVARGFGSGLIPKAPGTFGSLVGVVLFLVLADFRSFWLYTLFTVTLAVSSVWVCDAAEKILNQHDPGSVVWDEIVAMPVCFLGWVGWAAWNQGGMPGQQYFLDRWPVILVGFALFRLLDVTKPGPIGRIQNLPGGLGVTADDILAAIGVNLLLLPFFPWW